MRKRMARSKVKKERRTLSRKNILQSKRKIPQLPKLKLQSHLSNQHQLKLLTLVPPNEEPSKKVFMTDPLIELKNICQFV
jgi:hypothetical protein